MASKFSIIPTHDGICLVLPSSMTATIDLRDDVACDELLDLGADVGNLNEEAGCVPLIYRHGEITIRGFDFRETTIEELKSYAADIDKIKTEIEEEFRLRADARREQIMGNLRVLPDNVQPITKSL
jgi:hypothetical protein